METIYEKARSQDLYGNTGGVWLLSSLQFLERFGYYGMLGLAFRVLSGEDGVIGYSQLYVNYKSSLMLILLVLMGIIVQKVQNHRLVLLFSAFLSFVGGTFILSGVTQISFIGIGICLSASAVFRTSLLPYIGKFGLRNAEIYGFFFFIVCFSNLGGLVGPQNYGLLDFLSPSMLAGSLVISSALLQGLILLLGQKFDLLPVENQRSNLVLLLIAPIVILGLVFVLVFPFGMVEGIGNRTTFILQ